MISSRILRHSVVLAAAGLLAVTPASAGPLTITWGAQRAGGALATANGRELPSGSLVRLGYFNITLRDVGEIAWDLVALEQHFTELGRASIGDFDGTSFGIPGGFAQTLPADSTQLPHLLASHTVCVWAIDAPTLADAREVGVFTSETWQAGAGLVGSVVWDLSQTEAGGLVVGSFSPTQSPTFGGQMLQLASVATLRDASDDDRDGAPALIEEALGMNPNQTDSDLMPQAVTLGTGTNPLVGYRFRRPVGGTAISSVEYQASGFRYIVEVSDDLRQWRIDPSVCQVHTVTPAGDGYEVVTLRPPLSRDARPDFYRLKVERTR